MSDLDSLRQAQQARRENLARWREKRIHKLPNPLPVSGLEVWVRDVTMTDLMFTGKLPSPMVEMMQKLQLAGDTSVDLREVAANGEEFKRMLDILMVLCVIEPPIAEQADAEHISVDELLGDDKMAIYNWLNREVEQIKSFRDEGESVETVQPIGGIREEAERGNAAGDGGGVLDAGRGVLDGRQADREDDAGG